MTIKDFLLAAAVRQDDGEVSSPQFGIIIERVNTPTIRSLIEMIIFLLLLIEGSARAQYLR